MRSDTALLLVDIQNDYFPGGRMELEGIEAAARNAARLVAHFRKESGTIVHVRHVATQPEAGFFRPGTPGAEIHDSVRPAAGETVVVKHFPNSFRETPLESILRERNISTLVICGAMSHMCIDTTTRAAFDLGFSCMLADDACATLAFAHRGTPLPAALVHAAFMAALGQRFAEVLLTDEVLSRL